jgi:phosphate:Na+ symporter
LLERIIPLKKEEKLQHTFTFIDAPIHSTSELSALQAHKEIVLFATNVQFMISSLPILLKEKDQSQYDQLFETIKKTEDLADKFEVEITNFITRLSEHELSDRTSLSVRIMQKIADDLESIADECMGLARSIDVKNQQKVWFNQDMRDDLNQMFRLLSHAFIVLLENLRKEYLKADTEKPLLIEKQINEMRDHLRLKNIDNLNKGDYMHLNGNFFNDFVFRSEKIGDLICNINDTLTGYIDDYHHL